jgi:predicted transposase/invertase (TIGR01784 family)
MSRYLDPKADQAVALSEEAANTPGELEVYESYWDQVRREKTIVIDSFTKGLLEGEARGKAEGEAKLNQELCVIVKNLLKLGIDIQIVMTSTGLTRKEIEEIQKEF